MCLVYLYMITGVFQDVNIFSVIIQFKTLDMILKGKSCERNSKVIISFMAKTCEIPFFPESTS